jgi:hypothetical protein
MATKDTVGSPALKADLPPFLNWGQERTGAALALQKELLASFEQVNRAWLARVQSEVGLWSDLADKVDSDKDRS